MELETKNIAMNLHCRYLYLCCFPLLTLGCANLWNTPSTSAELPAENNQALDLKNPPKLSVSKSPSKRDSEQTTTTDLYWQVPGEAVEWYYLFYGDSPSNLKQQLAVKTVDLEKFPSAEYGAVFRYQLSVPRGQTIYLKIVSENRFGKSGDSQLIKITNGKQEAVKR